MKTYILIPLAVLSLASVALSQNKPYLLATVLFYNDGQGHQIVAAGHVHKTIKKAIRKDILRRLGNKTSRIVSLPLFHQLATAPAASEITGFVKGAFPELHLVEIPKELSSKVVSEKRRKMPSRKMKNNRLDDLAKDTHINDEAVNTNSISEGKFDAKSIDNIGKICYQPHTVCYAVEHKCLVPNDYTCYINKERHHIKTSHKKPIKSRLEKPTSKGSLF